MITIDALENLGVNTKEGLSRCINNEAFYLRLFEKAIKDSKPDELKEKIESKDYDSAFEIAHSLKGVYGNLSITPLYDIVSNITEYLRERKDIDYSSYINNIIELRDKFVELTK